MISDQASSACRPITGIFVAAFFAGIGPFERPLVDFVLGHWTEAEWTHIKALGAPFARFLTLLAGTEELGTLGNLVNPPCFWDPDREQKPSTGPDRSDNAGAP